MIRSSACGRTSVVLRQCQGLCRIVRTQHLPPPAETARGLGMPWLAGRHAVGDSHPAKDTTGRITANGAVMGYICPDCGEGLPEDTACPCTMAGGDFNDEDDLAVSRGPLTAEIASIRSPVRRFLGEWFTSGLRDLQRRYREAAPSLAVGRGPGRRRPRDRGHSRRLASAVPRAPATRSASGDAGRHAMRESEDQPANRVRRDR